MTPKKSNIYSLSMNLDREKNILIPIAEEKLSAVERKSLIDSLIDPIFVISNANSMLIKKLEKFVDSETRENFYMIERSQKKLTALINQLRENLDSEN